MNESKATDYKYYAFISYSRKNEKTAKWLQKKLETYRLPTVLQKQNSSLPKKLKVFRDQTDIGVGGTVEHALSRELRDSKKLIVLCSPDSAQSDYVEYEIASFLKLGRSTDDILPFVIDGKIDSKSGENCYTPLLESLNLNAADAVQEGKRTAFVRLLASLLEIKYDDLKKRECARTARRNTLFGMAAGLILAFAGLLTWYVTPHTKYYTDYVTRWGVPEGIGKKLTKSEIIRRSEHYEITYRYGKAVKLMRSNSKKAPLVTTEGHWLERQNRPIVAEYKYENMFFPQHKRNQKITEATYTIATGTSQDFIRNHRLALVYSGRTEESVNIDFYYNNSERLQKSLSNDVFSRNGIYYADIQALSPTTEMDEILKNQTEGDATRFFIEDVSAIYRHHVVYDKETGYEKEITFLNKNNRIVADKNGVKGFIFEYDRAGRLVVEEYRYSEYEPSSIISKKLKYDESGNLVEVSFHNFEENELADNKKCGFAKKTITWDENSKNPVKFCFFDEDDLPAQQAYVYNAISYSISYNDNGFEESSEIIDGDGNTIISTGTLNNHGLLIEFFATQNGEQILHSMNEYNEEHHMTKNIFYQSDGTEALRIEYAYEIANEEEKITEHNITQSFYTVNVFDKFGRFKESSVIGETGETGTISRIDYKGDNRSICFYYADGSYYDSPRGYARADFSYNNDGRLVYVAFKNRSGILTNCSLPGLHFCSYQATYSPNNILLEAKYTSESDGKLMLADIYTANSVYAPYYIAKTDSDDTFVLEAESELRKISYNKNEDGQTVVTETWPDGEIVNQKVYDGKELVKRLLYDYQENGDYKIFTLDAHGRELSSEYKDSSGKTKNRPGQKYSTSTFIYYENGRKEINITDETDFLVTKFLYNEFGVEEKATSYNSDGTYDERFIDEHGNTLFKKYDTHGSLLSEYVFQYADDGSYTLSCTDYEEDMVLVSYFDKNKNRQNNSEGWAKKIQQYINGQKRTLYSTKENQTILCKSGYVMQVTDVFSDSFAMQNGIQTGDIILKLGQFDYFNNGTFESIELNKQDEVKQCVIYNPKTKKLTKFSSVSFGFSFKPVFPTNDEESSLDFIADMKSAYNKFVQKM